MILYLCFFVLVWLGYRFRGFVFVGLDACGTYFRRVSCLVLWFVDFRGGVEGGGFRCGGVGFACCRVFLLL